MWYENAWRRHLCDMHIEEWNPEFMASFDPEKYLDCLRRANVNSAMLPLQTHVGLCYYPTKSGKMHNAFNGREDMMKRLVNSCHKSSIYVTGYYSLIYNNYEHDRHPEWRMIDLNGTSLRVQCVSNNLDFAARGIIRTGYCCPNNMEYRKFVAEQIREMTEYFELDGMFYDMLFWPQICYCDSCRERWKRETGSEMPVADEKNWHIHDVKHKEWMTEFAVWVAEYTKKIAPYISVEHNYAGGLSSSGRCTDETLNAACDYVGGDLYDNPYKQSFACKFYKTITNNQPFEYMFSRCEPNLGMHTTLKSEAAMTSAVFLTAANHGATLVIDAIDPVGTLDRRVYDQIGSVLKNQIPYEKYLGSGEMIEDIGIYYSMNKLTVNSPYTNHSASLITAESLTDYNIPYGVTGRFADINKYKAVIAPALIKEDCVDNSRLISYVEGGGKLYFSGEGNSELLESFFGAKPIGVTDETVTYISPDEKYQDAFGRFNRKYPLHFDDAVPKITGFDKNDVIATVTLPYTRQDKPEFASIHSNPPGIATEMPAILFKKYGRGCVLWSGAVIEGIKERTYKRIFCDLIRDFLDITTTVYSDAPYNTEVTAFRYSDCIRVNIVLLNSEDNPGVVDKIHISVKYEKQPESVSICPDGTEITFSYSDGLVSFTAENIYLFSMYEIK